MTRLVVDYEPDNKTKPITIHHTFHYLAQYTYHYHIKS